MLNDAEARSDASTPFQREVADRFGVLPNFFCTAQTAPGLIEELWGFAKAAYLDSPLPSRFKERLFVHLSRFCEIRYCIVRHVGFLIGNGRPAGDADASHETVDEVVALLRRPIPDAVGLPDALARLTARDENLPIPEPGSQAEADLFDALTVIFVEPAMSERARVATRAAVGDARFELLAAYLAFIRTAHYWTETHPELAYEPDMLAVMEARADLTALLLSPSDAERVKAGRDLRQVLAELQQTETALRASEARFRAFVTASSDVVYRMSPDWTVMRQLDGNGFIVDTSEPTTIWMDRYIHPDDRPFVWNAISEAIRTKSVFELEHRLFRVDGTLGWTLSRAVPICDAQGEIVEWFGAASDVTARREAEEALRESEEHLDVELRHTTLLRDLAARLVTEGSETAIYQEILSAAVTMMASDAGTVQVYEPESSSLLLLVTEGIPSAMTNHFRRVDAATSTACGTTLRTGRRTFVDYDQNAVDEACRMHVEAGLRSAQATPLLSRDGSPIGMINTHWRASGHRPREDQLRFLDLLARQAADLIEGARAQAALRESEQALAADLANAERLRSLSERLVPEESFQAIYDEVLSATVAITRADAGTIQIYDPATKALELLASLNFSCTITDYFHRVDAGSRTACGIALKTGERAFVDFSDEVADLGCQLLAGEGIKSAVAYPLVSRTGAPLGMLNAHWRQAGHRLSGRELRFLDLLARQAADLIERRQSERALRESEERLRQFGEASSDVLWIRDAESLQWVYLTPAFETIYDLDRGTALGGDNMAGWLDMILPDDRPHALAAIECVRAGERVTFEYRIRQPRSGAMRWLRNTDFPMRAATGQVRWLGGVGRDITEEKAAIRRQEVLVNELQHRARNLLGVVTAVAGKTLRQGSTVESFEERLQALSRAQALLSQAGSDTVEVGAMVRAELSAYTQAGSEKVRVGGPEVQLTARQVQNFALALHELTTNAVKYGALKDGTRSLAVTWEVLVDRRDRRRLALSWVESGVAIEPEKVTRRGYGTELIQEALGYALEADVEYELSADGVRCRVEMPINKPG